MNKSLPKCRIIKNMAKLPIILLIIQGLMFQILITAQNINSRDLHKVENPTRVSKLTFWGSFLVEYNQLGRESREVEKSLNPNFKIFEGLSFDREPGSPFDSRERPCINGATGKNYYIQVISGTSKASIFNKIDGSLLGTLDYSLLFYAADQAGSNIDKPIILYDEQIGMFIALARIVNFESNPQSADYFSFSTLKFTEDGIRICRWAFGSAKCDNAKMGIQQDGYYISINAGSNERNIDEVFVINRYAVINNWWDVFFMSFRNPARPKTLNGFHYILPIDIDGAWAPSNTPGMFITIADDDQGNPSDEIRLYELKIEWHDLWSSTFKMSDQIPVSSFCNVEDIMIRQNMRTQYLESNSGVLSHRAQYRKIGEQEIITCLQTVTDNKSATGLRWYQLHRDNNNHNWTLSQEGLLQDNSSEELSMYNGSIAMTANGDIFIGYHASSLFHFPRIQYCGQSNGVRSHIGNGQIDIPTQNIWQSSVGQSLHSKWGSFSNMSCDPTDNNTVWYTNYCLEHNFQINGRTFQHCITPIVAITMPDCTPKIQSNHLNIIAYDTVAIYGSIIKGDGDYVLVVVRKQETPISEPISGYSYQYNTNFGSGDTTGPGNYVVNFLPRESLSGNLQHILIKNLEAGNGYFIDIYEANSTGDDGYCYKLPAYTSLACTKGIQHQYHQYFDDWNESTPDYSCTENGSVTLTEGWVNFDDDDIDWDINSGSTKSSYTGPTTDISLVGKYVYTEASSCSDKTGYLTMPAIDLTTIPSPVFTFYYHMWGTGMGSLSIEHSLDGGITWSDYLWSKEGDQGNQWHMATIPLSSFSDSDQFRIRFKSITGDNYKSDIAIDEVSIKTQTSGIPYLQTFDSWQISNPWYSCTSDGSVVLTDQWKNATGDDVDWDIYSGSTPSNYTGPSSGYSGSGNYLYLEASSCYNKTGYLESPIFDLSSSNYPELKFYYHMFCEGSDRMGSLKVEFSVDYGNTWEEVWSKKGNQGDQWNEALIKLDAYNNTKGFVFRFTGITGNNYRSDIAVDHVSIDSPCLPIFSFPYTMNFDSFSKSQPQEDCTQDGSVKLNDCWLNVLGDEVDWDVHSGSTASGGTGPSTGYNGFGNYLYLESSYCWRKKASIKSPIFDFSISHMRRPRLGFQYHMYGENMGSFQVDISKDGGSNWEEDCIYSIYGNQGNQWNSATINLQEYLNETDISFRFTGITGDDFTSDIAIDEMIIFDECVRLNFPYEEGFENWVDFSCQSNSFCNPNGSMDLLPYCWENCIDDDFDWGVGKGMTPSEGTGPSSGVYGSSRYLYTEVSGGACYNKEASVQSPDFDMSSVTDQPLLYFNYHMYGEEMGTLFVDISTDFGSTWTNLWSKSGNQGNQWLYEVIPLSNYISNPYVRLKFKAISGPEYTSDIAIDNIKISAGDRANTSNLLSIHDEQNQISESTPVLSLNVFPNPNNGIFNMVINSRMKRDVKIKIINTMGVTIYQQDKVVIHENHKSEINLSVFPKGAYYLIINSNKNETVKKTIMYN